MVQLAKLDCYLQQNQPIENNTVWREMVWWLFLLTSASIITAFGVAAYMIPKDIALFGISEVTLILISLWNTPIGLLVLIAAVLVLCLGCRYIRAPKFVVGIVYYLVVYSLLVNLLIPVFEHGITNNTFEAAILGGAVNVLSGHGF